ncbi:hypothetical protein Tco_0396556 [Tanacetum coccineum]
MLLFNERYCNFRNSLNHSSMKGLEANDLGSYFMQFLSILRNIPPVCHFRSMSDENENAFKKLQEMDTQLSREIWNTEAIGIHLCEIWIGYTLVLKTL